MSEATLNELRQDLEECEQLQKAAKRPKVQEILLKEVNRLNKEVFNLEKKISKQAETTVNQTSKEGADGVKNCHGYIENITNYGFDQSNKFMEVYLPLDGLSSISDNNIYVDFSNRSFTVRVQFPNRTCQLHIARLCEDIVPKECYFKKKSKHVLVMLKKAEVGKTWSSLTEQEKKAKDKKNTPKFDEHEDPGASLTRLLKNMYDEGDDEMKRTLSKAWYESQTKKARDDESIPDL